MNIKKEPSETLLDQVRLSDYHYELPPNRIAKFPLEQRDQSKLLYYQSGVVKHHKFQDLPELLPENSLLVFNDTKVVKARLFFRRNTGANIEVLLLHPIQPLEIQQALMQKGEAVWECAIGNKKRWKEDEKVSLETNGNTLHAKWVDRENNIIRFSWDKDLVFSEWLEIAGNLPLPPYLNRDAEESDSVQYQTIYAREKGAVAAPTAGLHFTQRVFDQLEAKGHHTTHLTLHVGAGTFLPVKVDKVKDHDMHREQMVISRDTILGWARHSGPIIPVGTTSMRFLESLYWLGVKISLSPTSFSPLEPFLIDKLEPYLEYEALPDKKEALEAIFNFMKEHGMAKWVGETRIFILPGYEFHLCRGIITNFHMPETTLMLLVGALVGNNWKNIYQEALDKGYRFLSYGDSSLLLPGIH